MESNLQIASRKSRLCAFLLDHFFITLLVLFPGFFLIGEDGTGKELFFYITISMVIYFPLLLIKEFYKGTSPGKWLFGIGVRDQEDHSVIPSKGRLALRNIPVIIYFVEIFVLALSKNKQRVGDRLAKTMVVQKRKIRLWKIILSLVMLFILFGASVFGITIYFIKSSEAYQTAEEYIKDSPQIQNTTGGIEDFGLIPSGNVQITNGHGEAYLTIKVIGEKKDTYVDIYLTKTPNEEWTVQRIEQHE